jgi:DNA-binding GntR family transcriptional regulator
MSKYAAKDGHLTGGAGTGYQYQRIADGILAEIESGEMEAGTRLTPERELAEQIGNSYGTVRRAYKQLRDNKLVFTKHGGGPYVCWPGGLTEPPPPTPEEQAARAEEDAEEAREDEAGL